MTTNLSPTLLADVDTTPHLATAMVMLAESRGSLILAQKTIRDWEDKYDGLRGELDAVETERDDARTVVAQLEKEVVEAYTRVARLENERIPANMTLVDLGDLCLQVRQSGKPFHLTVDGTAFCVVQLNRDTNLRDLVTSFNGMDVKVKSEAIVDAVTKGRAAGRRLRETANGAPKKRVRK